MKYDKLQQIFSLLTCFLMMLAVAVNKNQSVLGFALNGDRADKVTAALQRTSDGTVIISTKELAKDIMGYGGNTPVEIYLKDGFVTDIKALRNAETPDFFGRLESGGMFSGWIGLSVDEALLAQVDAVSGATLSSDAVIGNVRRGLQYAEDAGTGAVVDHTALLSPKLICTVIVILMGGLLPFFIRSRRYRMIQLVLNVIVLGFWSGSFISYSLLVNYLSSGFNVWISIVPMLLLAVAFILPLFGRKSHYCTWVCPLGSLQEIMGKCVGYKWRMAPGTVKYLNYFRDGLWAVLMLLMWAGVFFRWMDYELFTAFLFRQAATAVIVVAVVFMLLSCVVNRPYCRFVCPTGNLLRISQNTK